MSEQNAAALVAHTYTRRDRPYCEFEQGGTILVRDYENREVMRLTLAAAEELAEVLRFTAATGREWAAALRPQATASDTEAVQ